LPKFFPADNYLPYMQLALIRLYLFRQPTNHYCDYYFNSIATLY